MSRNLIDRQGSLLKQELHCRSFPSDSRAVQLQFVRGSALELLPAANLQCTLLLQSLGSESQEGKSTTHPGAYDEKRLPVQLDCQNRCSDQRYLR